MGETQIKRTVLDEPTPRRSGSKPPDDPSQHHQPCHACGSEDTATIHYEASGCNIGFYVESEHRCRQCGKYTLYEYDWDS